MRSNRLSRFATLLCMAACAAWAFVAGLGFAVAATFRLCASPPRPESWRATLVARPSVALVMGQALRACATKRCRPVVTPRWRMCAGA